MIALLLSEDLNLRKYHRSIDGTLGDHEQLRIVLRDMILEGLMVDIVNDILQAFPFEQYSVRDVFTDALSSIGESLRCGEVVDYSYF